MVWKTKLGKKSTSFCYLLTISKAINSNRTDMVDINPTRSIITVNVIALKALIRRPEIVRVNKKIRPHCMLSR